MKIYVILVMLSSVIRQQDMNILQKFNYIRDISRKSWYKRIKQDMIYV
jgi:hypothetical protein